jgi:hypothetical protein
VVGIAFGIVKPGHMSQVAAEVFRRGGGAHLMRSFIGTGQLLQRDTHTHCGHVMLHERH